MTSTHAIASGDAERPLLHALARNWWMIALRGAAAILFGLLAFVWPGATMLGLVIVYGAFALVDGVLAIATAAMGEGPAPRMWLTIAGALGVAAGLLTLGWPGITALVLLFFIGVWAIAVGLMQIVGAIKLRDEIDNEWWLLAGGVLSMLFGVGVLTFPGAGALALILLIGTYAIAYGITLVMLSLRLRGHHHEARAAE
jgi:uncharacterized membrane protein HdeD (DUF308 family)